MKRQGIFYLLYICICFFFAGLILFFILMLIISDAFEAYWLLYLDGGLIFGALIVCFLGSIQLQRKQQQKEAGVPEYRTSMRIKLRIMWACFFSIAVIIGFVAFIIFYVCQKGC